MMRNWFIIALVIAIAATFLAGCGGSGPGSSSTLSGRVINGPTGEPLQGARVALGAVSATTGSDGNFVIRNVPSGSGVLTAQLTGFEVASVGVTITAGANTLDSDVLMAPITGDPPGSVPRTVDGTIKLDNGSNGTGVNVKILNGATQYDETTTDENGKYSFWVPSGTYTIRASKAGYTTVDQSVTVNDLSAVVTSNFTLTPQ